MIYTGDALTILKTLESESVNCVITSPPYWAMRDYLVEGQLGREDTFEEYIETLCCVFDEVKRVLRKDGTCFVNLGDVYGGTGSKKECRDPKYKDGRNGQTVALNQKYQSKCLLQIPSRFAIAMCERGWILRNECIWHKPNAMPSPIKDRFSVDYEKIFFFVKSKKYAFEQQYSSGKYKRGTGSDASRGDDADGLVVGGGAEGRNMRTVWSIPTKPFNSAHVATFPEALVEPMLLAGCPIGGIVLDPFAGAGTVGVVAKKLRREFVGIELNKEYVIMANERISNTQAPML